MHLLEEGVEGDAPVDVGAEDVQVRDLLGDDVDVLQVPVRHRDRARGVHLLDPLRHVDLGHHDRARLGVRVVRVGVEDAAPRDPVAGHRVVEDRVDPVLLVDVLHPLRRDPHVRADRVPAHAGGRVKKREVGLRPHPRFTRGHDMVVRNRLPPPRRQ